MKDPSRINPERIEETAILKQRIKELEQSESERNRAEALIRGKEEWERTFHAIPDLIALIDTDHRIIRANGAMAARLGCTPEQIEGCYCYEAVHGLSAPPDFCPHAKLLASGKEEQVEVEEERLGGIFNVSATPLRNETGQLVGSVHVARNITDIKQAEEALRDSRERFRTLADCAFNWETWTDDDGQFLYISPSCRRITGYSANEFLNDLDLMMKIIHPDDREHFLEHRQQVVTDQVCNFDFRIACRSGEERWINHICRPIWDTDGKSLGRRASNQDITKQKDLEKELDAYNRQLEDFVKHRTVELQVINERLIQEIVKQEEISKSLIESRKEVEEKAKNLEEINTALNVLLKHREADREDLANNVMLSVKQLVTPYIDGFKNASLNAKNKMLVEMIEVGLKDITTPFIGKLSVAYKEND